MRWMSLVLLVAAIGAQPASADGGFLCRWQADAAQVHYATLGPQESASTDVRAIMQGAVLVDAQGRFPRFVSLTQAQPEQRTEALRCEVQGFASDGLLQLSFTRRVRFGVEFTLGRCQVFYHCPAAGEATPVGLLPRREFLRLASPEPRPGEAPGGLVD